MSRAARGVAGGLGAGWWGGWELEVSWAGAADGGVGLVEEEDEMPKAPARQRRGTLSLLENKVSRYGGVWDFVLDETSSVLREKGRRPRRGQKKNVHEHAVPSSGISNITVHHRLRMFRENCGN